MMSKIAELVKGESLVAWLLIAILVVYFVYKEWPEFRNRVSHGAVKEKIDEQSEKTLEKRLGGIEKEVKEINEKLDRDYKRINLMEAQIEKTKTAQANTSEELEIIMRALLGVLRGLQEQGTNGPTKDAEAEIQEYLNKKAHKGE